MLFQPCFRMSMFYWINYLEMSNLLLTFKHQRKASSLLQWHSSVFLQVDSICRSFDATWLFYPKVFFLTSEKLPLLKFALERSIFREKNKWIRESFYKSTTFLSVRFFSIRSISTCKYCVFYPYIFDSVSCLQMVTFTFR